MTDTQILKHVVEGWMSHMFPERKDGESLHEYLLSHPDRWMCVLNTDVVRQPHPDVFRKWLRENEPEVRLRLEATGYSTPHKAMDNAVVIVPGRRVTKFV